MAVRTVTIDGCTLYLCDATGDVPPYGDCALNDLAFVKADETWRKRGASGWDIIATDCAPRTFGLRTYGDVSIIAGIVAALDQCSGGSAVWGNIAGTLASQSDLQTALNAKAPTASPTFTGTVSGVTKTHVGLGNVDNTTDASKPISTATQTALDGKSATGHTHAQLHDRQHSITETADHTFPGGTTTFLRADGTFQSVTASIAAPFTGNQAPGDFTIADGQFGLHGDTLALSASQTATIEGSGSLIISG